jgi:hypothetical protein
MSLNRHPRGRFFLLFALRSIRFDLAVVASLLLLAACATAPREQLAGKSLEEQVKERAANRWNALINGDIDAAYGYFSKATKNTYPIELYRAKMRPGMWREARVDSVKCADEVCDVTVILTIDHAKIKGVVTPVAERWIIQDGQAWYVYNG